MKLYLKILIGILIGIVLLHAFLIIMGGIGSLQSIQNQNANNSPKATTKTRPTVTSQPALTSSHSIIISYSIATEPYYTWIGKSGDNYYQQAESGKVFLEVNMTITNNGYDSFNINPFYFSAATNNVKYSYDSGTFSLHKWDTFYILNGETFVGTILFQVPASSSSFTLGYDQSSNFNIVWTQT